MDTIVDPTYLLSRVVLLEKQRLYDHSGSGSAIWRPIEGGKHKKCVLI